MAGRTRHPGDNGRVAFATLASRLTGISTPLLGLQWTPPADERQIVRSLLVMLEDRRVLFVDRYAEVEMHAVDSVFVIRSEITKALQQLPATSHANGPLRAMRGACRRFLDTAGHGRSRYHEEFLVALGELRATFGLHIASLAYTYQIDVEPELAAILPENVGDGDGPE